MILIDTQKEELKKLQDISIFGKADKQSGYNGDLLVLGLGGMGSKVVCNLKGMLMNHLTPEDNIHFMMMDSSIPEMEETIENSKERVGLNALEVISIYRPNLKNLLANGILDNPVHPNLAKWMKKDFPNISIGTDGAKGNRQIGRLMFSNAYEDMRVFLFEKLDEFYRKSKKGKLDVIVVSSVCGGTGSGIIADVTYNIKAYAKSKKWENFRVGGCLLMPDVLFGNKQVRENSELASLLKANGCATLKEIDYLMRVANHGEGFLFESTTHRLTMRENIFDACMLVSGKKDEQGYIPEGIIYSDVAYFLQKLASNKYIASKVMNDDEEKIDRQLLRDAFFDQKDQGYFKVINESDYRIPVREIENICENDVFQEAYKRMFQFSIKYEDFQKDMNAIFAEVKAFLEGKPGEPINLKVNNLIDIGSLEKPNYKMIKKGMDDLRTEAPRKIRAFESVVPLIMKEIKNDLSQKIADYVTNVLREYGPFIAMDVIGAKGYGNCDADTGIIVELKKMSELQKKYHATGEYDRIIDSILEIVRKRFFTFPGAKKETENGYYDAWIKNVLEKERTMLVDGILDHDVFDDIIRLLRRRAEHLDEVFSPFSSDLKNAVEDYSNIGKRTAGYLLKEARRQEFLPSDYITEERIEEMRHGIINLMVNHESDIDNGRTVPIKQEMEKIYKNILIGIGTYAPEKLITVAFANEKPNLMDTNIMFVSPTNAEREEIMKRAALAFVSATREKSMKKKLCVLKDNVTEMAVNKKYISLPESMPYFSKAVNDVLISELYNEDEDTITTNAGDAVISVDDIFFGVRPSALKCAEEMQEAYNAVDTNTYFGLHVDEETKDMRSYPDIL